MFSCHGRLRLIAVPRAGDAPPRRRPSRGIFGAGDVASSPCGRLPGRPVAPFLVHGLAAPLRWGSRWLVALPGCPRWELQPTSRRLVGKPWVDADDWIGFYFIFFFFFFIRILLGYFVEFPGSSGYFSWIFWRFFQRYIFDCGRYLCPNPISYEDLWLKSMYPKVS
jgi:hypothetical protein